MNIAGIRHQHLQCVTIVQSKPNLLAPVARFHSIVTMLLCGLLFFLVLNRDVAGVTANNGIHSANVPPTGWRRTIGGWERAEEWGKPVAKAQLGINQWLAIQDQRESTFARGVLGQLRSIHPLFISVVLLGAVIATVLLNERKSMDSGSSEHPSRR